MEILQLLFYCVLVGLRHLVAHCNRKEKVPKASFSISNTKYIHHVHDTLHRQRFSLGKPGRSSTKLHFCCTCTEVREREPVHCHLRRTIGKCIAFTTSATSSILHSLHSCLLALHPLKQCIETTPWHKLQVYYCTYKYLIVLFYVSPTKLCKNLITNDMNKDKHWNDSYQTIHTNYSNKLHFPSSSITNVDATRKTNSHILDSAKRGTYQWGIFMRLFPLIFLYLMPEHSVLFS